VLIVMFVVIPVIASHLGSLQRLVDDGTSCQIPSRPRDAGLLRVSLSLQVCPQESVCVCVRLCPSLFSPCASYFLDNFSACVCVCVCVCVSVCVCVCCCPVHSRLLSFGLSI